MRVDLHIHSTFSDGLFTPTELVAAAVKAKLAAISLTDHDSLDGFHEAACAGKENGVEVVPGVELSSQYQGRDLHILGYGVDPDDDAFQEMLRRFRERRHKRGLKIIEKLNVLGITIEPAEVLAKSGKGALGRPHVAAVLLEKGVVSRTGEAFDKYIAEGGPAYVPKYKMTAGEAIEHIHGAGGLAFVAHPGVFLEHMDELQALIDQGFDGVEVYHPTHSQTRSEELKKVATRNGLLISGGTDFHGFSGRDVPMGGVKVPYELWEKMKARIQEHHKRGKDS
ncbi:MAG: PHP domain-containing protein [Candidatus Krumholzibacteria bacterium]|nr:PHP domain-containing protein [Candidatus Krumholzibacteria bacterium]